MPVSFPVTKRYFAIFRHSDTGLTPSFTYFKRTDTLADVLPQPTFTEVSNGAYFFTYTWNAFTDPDIIFEIDGGVSIPTEEIRYKTDIISPKDFYLDQPNSQVAVDVWTDSATYLAGTKGNKLDNVPSVTGLADAVWDEPLAGHLIAGSAGRKLSDTSTSTEVTTAQNTITTSLGAQLTRALGLMHENSVLDQTVFDGQNNLTNGRLRIYNSKANALAAGVSGLLETYTITASYVGDNVQTYTVVREGS